MYVLVRKDLPLAQQLVQAAHATMECGIYLAGTPEQPDNLVLCSVDSESELRAEAQRITAAGVRLRLVEEPDIGDQATALATEPLTGSRRRLFRYSALWIPSHDLVAHSLEPSPHEGSGGETPPRIAMRL